MRKILVILVVVLISSLIAFAQNTSVTGQVTDANSQPWFNGTFTFTFVGPQNVQWTGGPFNPNIPITGNMSGTGSIPATNVPDNNQINPAGSQWNLKVCSATLPVVCSTKTLTVTGATQTINITPVPIVFQVPTSPSTVIPITAYADNEITGGWVGFPYYNLSIPSIRTCSVVTGLSCSSWISVGAGNASFSPIQKASTQTGATADIQISNAIASLAGGSGVVWADYSTNQTWASCPTFGSGSVYLILYPVTYSIAVNCTIPVNVALQFYQGATLAPATGTTTTDKGNVISGITQIFSNAVAGQGTIDFTGNISITNVSPEWWGASITAIGSVNSPAIQAAVTAAYGIPNRTNGSPNAIYNKTLLLAGIYAVNATISANSMNGFKWMCIEKLSCGFKQTTTNTSILSVTCGGTYGSFVDILWETAIGVSQDLLHPLVNLDHTCGGSDLATQSIDFVHNIINGAGVAKIGIEIAASGGAAQGSSIYFHNIEAQQFTEAAVMIGAGSGCTPSSLATNAGAITFWGGDFQANPAFAVELFGPGIPVDFFGTTFEDSVNLFGAQTGYDVCGQIGAAGAFFRLHGVRSESPFTTGGPGPYIWYDSFNADQAPVPTPGGTPSVNQIIQGYMGSHGAWYQVTAVSSAFSGLGSVPSPLSASSGTATTIVDSVGGFTVNAWTGWQISIVSGTANNEWCIVTSNTANTFTCSAGWKTDFPATVTIVNPDNTTKYIVEPNYLLMTVNGGVTFAAITKKITICGSYGHSFIPGLQVSGCSEGSRFHELHVTRGDWIALAAPIDGLVEYNVIDGVMAGFSSNGPGGGAGDINTGLLRLQTLTRNGITEVGRTLSSEVGTRILHFFAGQNGGGISTVDTYFGAQPVAAGNFSGTQFLCNNSNNLNLCTNWDPDGKMRHPPVSFATLQACSAANEGGVASVKDSTTATYGATITGGGANHVHAYCNGTNWVVD